MSEDTTGDQREAEAVAVATLMVGANPYLRAKAHAEKAAEIDMTTTLLLETLGTAPMTWVREHVTRIIRAGQIPEVAPLAAAWQAEARHRLANAPAGRAPAAVEDDAAAYREWERARRHAILAGADADRAQAYANQMLGVAPDRPAITAGEVAEAKASFVAARAALTRGPQTVDVENR